MLMLVVLCNCKPYLHHLDDGLAQLGQIALVALLSVGMLFSTEAEESDEDSAYGYFLIAVTAASIFGPLALLSCEFLHFIAMARAFQKRHRLMGKEGHLSPLSDVDREIMAVFGDHREEHGGAGEVVAPTEDSVRFDDLGAALTTVARAESDDKVGSAGVEIEMPVWTLADAEERGSRGDAVTV